MFALRLLGGLSLESDTEPLPAGALQRRRLTLLALLALAGERGLSRERIQAHLWPESPADRARHALDQLLYATRRDLGHDAILSSATDLRLNPAVVRPDVWAFDDAIRDARWAGAAALYGGPLLSGLHLIDAVEFEHGLDGERARIDHDYHRALESLAAAAAARGDHAGAARFWRQRANADPLSAPVALQLMRALAAAGDRAGAVRHAQVHQCLVRDQLEIDPDPAVETLATQLAESRAETTHTDSPAPAAPASPAAPAPTVAVTDAASSPAWRVGRRQTRFVRAGALAVALCAVAAALLVASRPRDALPTPPPPRAAGDSVPTADVEARPTSAARHTADAQARLLYLRARASWERRTKPALEEAVVLYRQATDRDPEYADAYTGLAESYAMLGYFGFEPADAMFPKARAAAMRALDLDPAQGEAYAALGQALAWQHRWADAERAYQRGLAGAPPSPTGHQWSALLCAYLGRTHDAAVHTGEAARLDPLSVQINNMYGTMLYHDGDVQGALRQFERTVVAEPDSAWVRQNPWVLDNYGSIVAATGRHAEGRRLIERALKVVPTHPRALLDLAEVYVLMGRPDQARAAFARADTTHPHYLVYRAELYALLGQTDSAFATLDRVQEWPLPALVSLNSSQRFAALRADPRYAAIRERLGMPPNDGGSGKR